MRIYGSNEVQYFAYLLIIMYDCIVMYLNFREIGSIHAYHFTALSRYLNVCSTFPCVLMLTPHCIDRIGIFMINRHRCLNIHRYMDNEKINFI